MSTRNKIIALVLFAALMLLCLPALAAEPDGDGVLVDTSTYIYAESYKGRTDIKSVSLPNATYIGASAFQSCSELISVDAPNVEAMSDGVFYWCSKLESVSFPKLTAISSSTFVDCSNLTTLNIPLVKAVGDSAFTNCGNLSSFPFNNIETIGHSAFNKCSSLANVNAPVCVGVGSGAFSECSALEEVSFPSWSGNNYGQPGSIVWVSGANSVFNKCLALKSVNIPKLQTIGGGMFGSCSSLETLSLPAATSFIVSSIEDCPSLNTLQLDSVLSIDGALPCPSLENLAIPAANINANSAFQYCSKLKVLVIGSNGVESVNIGAIPNNSQLTVFVPNGLIERIGSKISSSGTISTVVTGYDASTIKPNLFFSWSKGETKSCVIQHSPGTDYSTDEKTANSVDTNGRVTNHDVITDFYTVIASKRISISPFTSLVAKQICRVGIFDVRAYASSLTDGSSGKINYSMYVYSRPYLGYGISGNYIQASQYPTFTFRSYDDEWYEITYGTNTAYLPKPCIALEGTTDYPDPDPSPGDGGNSGGSSTPAIPGGSSGEGIKMTVNINGKDTQVMLSLANFTYDYEQPETVTMISGFNLRKGPNAAFGTYRNVPKGTKLTIIGRDREWLKVDMGNGKIAYVLEDMTTK